MAKIHSDINISLALDSNVNREEYTLPSGAKSVAVAPTWQNGIVSIVKGEQEVADKVLELASFKGLLTAGVVRILGGTPTEVVVSDRMTRDELKGHAEAKGIAVVSTDTKADILSKLNGSNELLD